MPDVGMPEVGMPGAGASGAPHAGKSGFGPVGEGGVVTRAPYRFRCKCRCPDRQLKITPADPGAATASIRCAVVGLD